MPGNAHGAISSPSGFAITPSDTANLPLAIRGIYVGGTGNLRVLLNDDSADITLIGVLAGVIYSLNAKRVYSTNTTATNLIGLV